MKRKSIVTICAIALMLVLSLSVLAACNKNKHNFSSEWKNDEQYHWHECVTKKHTDVADKADHTFDAGVVTKEPTEAEEGVKTFTCTVCGYQKTEAVPKLGHTFDMNKWKYDDENHWHPATCGHTDEKKDLGAHVWNEGVVTKEPTEAEEGVKTYTCTTCGKTKTATIGRLDHEHTFNMEAWTFDDENHWHPATCGHTDEKKGFAAHEWNGGVVTTEPNYGVEGEKTFTCTVCKATKKEPIAALAAKDNEIVLKEGKTLGKEYDREAISITKDDFVIEGNREPAFMFKVKGADDNTYAATAPTNVGEYTVKVSVAATAEWKAASNTFDFAIAKKSLTATATKTYDGNATMPATLTGVVAGETVIATITMTSKNVGATVKEIMLEGADKDNYTLTAANVNASITPMTIGVDWWPEYDSTNVFTGEPAELLDGDEATITVTMASANVGAAVQDVEITGKDAANYSLAIEDVNVEIVKADIDGFEISNVSAFTEFFIGATNIPEPTTDYVEIGTGYGEKTIVWEMQVNADDNIWGPIFAGIDKVRKEKGYYRVRIQYAEGGNYNFGRTEYVYFTVKAKPRTLTVKNFAGKTYDGKPFANFTFNSLVKKFGATSHAGVENFTSGLESGEKYVEYRKKGEVLWTKVTDTYIPKNAAEYEYRIGVTATDEWEAVVSEVKTFTIKPYEFVLELGYGQNQHNPSYDSGKTFKLRTFNKTKGNELIEGQEIQLWLDNEKAGFKTEKRNNVYYFIPDQKKQVTPDCFFLKITNITNPVMENYKIVTKSPSVTTVEITVVEKLTTGKSTTGKIQALHETEKWINTTVEKGSFKVGQTVEVYNSAGVKLGEATITQIKVKGTISASGFAIPSDGLVQITLDQVFSGMVYGKLVEK